MIDDYIRDMLGRSVQMFLGLDLVHEYVVVEEKDYIKATFKKDDVVIQEEMIPIDKEEFIGILTNMKEQYEAEIAEIEGELALLAT